MDEDRITRFEKKLELQGGCVASFKHWRLYLDKKQYYLGRCFVWAKRKDAVDFFSMTKEEYDEFREVASIYREALSQDPPPLGRVPDMINVSFLGNEMTHCHGHLVPRYKEAPVPPFTDGRAQERDWTDHQWGHNWSHPDALVRADIDYQDPDDVQLCNAITAALSDAIRKVWEQ